MQHEFPIRIRINPAALDAFQRSEEGSHEDWKGGLQPYDSVYGDTHVFDILGRYRAVIEVRNADEAAEVYTAVCSGTFQLNDPEEGKPYFRTACRIANALRPVVAAYHPREVTRWPRPSGY